MSEEKLRQGLRDIIAHHEALNEKRGRPRSQSRTIQIAEDALGETLEWSGVVEGMGYGPMHNPGRGPLLPACPFCRGLKPTERARQEFTADAIGHQPGCRLNWSKS